MKYIRGCAKAGKIENETSSNLNIFYVNDKIEENKLMKISY